MHSICNMPAHGSRGIWPRDVLKKVSRGLYLVPAISHILFPTNHSLPTDVVFPPASPNGINESVTIHTIRFIEKIGKRAYKIHRTDSTAITISSISFSSLCETIEKQGVVVLQPVSRNEIINTSCIRSIYRTEKGRIEITLVHLPERIFHVGKKYESYFCKHFLSH